MALVLKDRVKETTTTTGTSTYTLAGAENGFEAFSQVGDGNTTYYCCTDGVDFEVGIGTYTLSGTTLARSTILQSSNSDAEVSWANGTRTIFCTQPAEKAVFLDANGNLPITSSISVGSSLAVTGDTTVGGTLGVTGVLTGTSLDISGDIDVDGTTNLDVVDIDGAVDMATTLGVTGNLTLGAQLIMPDVTSAKILVADGTSYQEVAVSGDVTIANTGAVTIGTGVVETGMIAADAITAGLIGDNVINSEHYAAGSIDLEHMSANSVDSDQYVDGSIDLIHMSANSVDSDQYVDGSIDLVHMSVNSVDSDQYVDGSIDTAHIADAQITVAKMAVNSVDSDQYVDGSIDTAHIANLQITTGLIAADAITAAKIADDVIDSEHYAAGSIDTEHIADANVTLAKIANQAANTVLVRDANSSGVVSAKAVATTQLLIGNGTGFTAAALSGDVTMTNAGVVTIGAGAVENSMLADDAVGADELAADAVVNASIAAGAAIADSKLAQIATAGKVALTALEIDGGTDIGADLATSDLIIVDDGAGGTNRKAALSRVVTLMTAQGFITDDPTALAIALG